MHLCLLALVLTTHAYEQTATRRVQVFDEVDTGVDQGDNTVNSAMDNMDNEPKETEHKPFKIVEREHEKLVTIVKKVCTFCERTNKSASTIYITQIHLNREKRQIFIFNELYS